MRLFRRALPEIRVWLPRALMSALLAVSVRGCSAAIHDYQLRQGRIVLVVQKGTSYRLGDCLRSTNGELSGCQLREVHFE